MNELKWYWIYTPYLDEPARQAESALKAGYNKVVFKDEADKVIAELQANREWHKVSDCKPPENTRVLVSIDIQGTKSVQIDDYTRDDGFASTRVPRFRIYGPYVTHWMPLPKGP